MKWTKDTSTTFGRRLQRIREARGLTQVELATAIGKSAQTISAWENGAGTKVQGSDIYKCAQTLLCRVSDLLAPVEAPVPLCPFWARAKKRLQRLAVRSSLADKS